MKVSVIWIDQEQARIFHFSDEVMERKRIRHGHKDHHSHQRSQLDQQREEKNLFSDAQAELQASSRILIVGPSIAKHHFQNFLMEHHPAVARKVVGLETVDHPSDGQIAAMAKSYFDRAG